MTPKGREKLIRVLAEAGVPLGTIPGGDPSNAVTPVGEGEDIKEVVVVTRDLPKLNQVLSAAGILTNDSEAPLPPEAEGPLLVKDGYLGHASGHDSAVAFRYIDVAAGAGEVIVGDLLAPSTEG